MEQKSEANALLANVRSKLKKAKRQRKEEKKNLGANVKASTSGLMKNMSSSISRQQQENRIASDPKIRIQKNISEIENYLKNRKLDGHGPVSAEKIEKDTHIKITNDSMLFDALVRHDSISYQYEKFSYKPKIDASNENELINEFRSRLFICKAELKGTYNDADDTIKDLEQDGKICIFPSDGKDKVMFYYDEELSNDPQVLKARAFLELWGRQSIPDDDSNRDRKCQEFHIEPIKALPVIETENPDADAEPVKRKRRSNTQAVNQNILDAA